MLACQAKQAAITPMTKIEASTIPLWKKINRTPEVSFPAPRAE
jgi:hypothetical protein